MKREEKKQIKEALQTYVARHASQNAAARSLRGVSEATISQLLNEKWDLISVEMWRALAAQIDYQETPWQHAETRNHRLITQLLLDAHKHNQVCAVIGEGGVGKTHAFKQYAQSKKGVVWLRCEKYWTQKYLLTQILKNMGHSSSNMTLIELIDEIVIRVKKQGKVLFIFDQFNKLRDGVKDLLIPIYNELEDRAGFFISGTGHLKTVFRRGVRLNKEGYQEMYSRMGRKFIEVRTPSATDIKQICYANSVEDASNIKMICADCEDDLRRVKRKIHGLMLINSQKKAA